MQTFRKEFPLYTTPIPRNSMKSRYNREGDGWYVAAANEYLNNPLLARSVTISCEDNKSWVFSDCPTDFTITITIEPILTAEDDS